MQLYPGMSSDRKLVHAFACDDQPDVNQGQYVGYKPFDSRSVGVEITSDKKSRTHFFCRSISVLRPSVEMPEAIVQRDGDNAQCIVSVRLRQEVQKLPRSHRLMLIGGFEG